MINDMQPPVGALMDADKQLYVERQSDEQALMHLLRGEIVTVIEPRQQGKTSLIYALRRNRVMESIPIVYIDVSTLPKDNASDWYFGFYERLLGQLSFLAPEKWPSLPKDAGMFRSFLADLARLLVQLDKVVIIALDEAATLRFPGSTEFFAVLRDVFNSRDAEKYFWQITFMLLGVFSPQDLIQDPKVSPFNIAIRISLDDFNLAQVIELTRRYSVDENIAEGLADSIYHWTDGQPYLSQLLCARLSHGSIHDRLRRNEVPCEAAVSEQVDRLFRGDDNHIHALGNRLEETLIAQPGLSNELRKIARGEAPSFYPAAIRWQETLQLLGIIKEAPNHHCMIRNRIYAKALEMWLELWPIPHVEQPLEFGQLFIKQRITDLASRLENTQKMLNQYEQEMQLAHDPRERARMMLDLQAIHKNFPAYQQEYQILLNEIEQNLSNDIHEIELRLKILQFHFDTLLGS